MSDPDWADPISGDPGRDKSLDREVWIEKEGFDPTMGDPTITSQFLQDSFGLDLGRISGVLEDLVAYNPGSTDLTDLSLEEKVDKLIAANTKSQAFIDGISDVLKEEREIRSAINSLNFKSKQAGKETINTWYNEIRTTLNIDDNVRTIQSKQREQINKMADRTVAINKARRALLAQEIAPAPAQPATLVATRFKIPDVPIPTFEGDIMEFYYFWKIYSNRVDSSPIDDSEKFSLLLGHLRRRPLDLVKNLPLNTIGYNQAKDRLTCRYGNKEEIADVITKRIFALRMCNNHGEVRDMFNKADAWISQLEDITGEQCKSKEIHRHLEQQLTKQYAGRVIDAKPAGTWNLKEFRDTMRTLVAKDENVDRMTGSGSHSRKLEEEPRRQQRSFGLATVQTTGCMFCKQNHPASKCTLAPQIKNGVVLKSKRCTKCLRTGHFNRQCKAEPCRRCQGPHHTFLCYKNVGQSHALNETRQMEPSTMVFAAPGEKTRPKFFKFAKSPRIMRKPITFRSVGVNARNGPQYMLMTRMATVFNPQTGWACKVGVMVDPGSTETFVTDDLKRKLNLKSGPLQSINLIRFGDTKRTQTLTGPKVQLGIRCAKEGEHISIEGMVVDDFLPALFCTDLNSNDMTYWSDQCKEMPPGRFVKPDILLGMKHLHLLNLQFQQSRGDGYQWWDSTIGPIICGVPADGRRNVAATALCKQIEPIGLSILGEEEEQVAFTYKSATWTQEERSHKILQVQRLAKIQDERERRALTQNIPKANQMSPKETSGGSSGDDTSFSGGSVGSSIRKLEEWAKKRREIQESTPV